MSSNNGGKNDDEDDRKDLTRIEDLSEFLHEEDKELEDRFGGFNRPEPSSTGIALDALDDDFASTTPEFGEAENSETDQVPPELPNDALSFDEPETSSSEDSFGDMFTSETTTEEVTEEAPPWETTEEVSFDLSEAPQEESSFSFDQETEPETETEDVVEAEPDIVSDSSYGRVTPEKFEDVKSFAQNFSYGQSQGGGNPPYSIIARNIRYKEDADDIMILLREFNLVTATNEAETIKALEFGSLLIPQISEYCAIVLAHKLRRYDLDLEVGLSDEIHPSKSGDSNPRGLVKKENLKQNKSESLNLSDISTTLKDFLMTTSSTLPGHKIVKHLGVQTTFTIVEEDELEKLSFVDRKERDASPLFELPEGESSLSSDQAFKNYHQSFNALYEDLSNQLKQKALMQKANAILGLSFQLSPLHFDRREKRINAYQITCSGTLASVVAEDA